MHVPWPVSSTGPKTRARHTDNNVALFRKKPADEGDDANEPAFTPQPDKALKWFEHAKTAAMSSNYDYALRCYAAGIKLDPGSMTAHENTESRTRTSRTS